ncbi:unnamed protein product [Triticum turgidum subsp. durum]|uniref:Uncharacterized protein n=1 Tax=Triticum turgidum subsp. durum TaxID=4567 RepID=A0A9R0YLX4_TRITD|nr:unnamed protein product [Triticum turgidum subsp. durum]
MRLGSMPVLSLFVNALLLFVVLQFDANAFATPTDNIVRQLSSVVKWPRGSPPHSPEQSSHPQYDGNVAVQFESGYFVETLVEGDKLGVTPHTIRVSPVEGGELLAVDSAHSNIVRITPPLSECMFFSCCPQFNAYIVLFKYFCAHFVGLLYGMKSVGLSEEWP